MTTVRRDFADSLALQGRNISSMITLANMRRSVVVPWAPTMGNILLARDAPDCMDAIAIRSNPTGNRVVARLEDCFVISE